MKALFLLTISPVQPFIAQSRKTQDLYAGSYILSHLCKTGITALQEELPDCTIILPYERIQSKPNRFLAEIEGDRESFRQIGKIVENRISKEWRDLGDSVIQKLGIPKPREFAKQMNYFLQIQWLVQPLESDYQTTYKSIERGMGELKRARQFFQLEEQGRKCTLTGEHNALFYLRNSKGNRPDYLVADAVEITDQPRHKHSTHKYIAEGEAISAIGLVKRCADHFFQQSEYDDEFPSKAHIALMESVHQLGGEFASNLRSYDASSVLSLYNSGECENQMENKQVIKHTESIYKALDKQGLPFTSYYAILLFDGDHMGKWFAGEYLSKVDSSTLKDFHTDFSKELGEFAERAKEILQAPNGVVVYAGGDDFLGFVNVHHLLRVMQQLRKAFEEINLSSYTDQKRTFSAGVVISHHKDMLSVSLNKAREMEQLAKENGRDSFGICVLRHSGEISQTVYKWQDQERSEADEEEDEKWLTKPMHRIVSGLQQDFSDTFIRSFVEEMSRLLDHDGKVHQDGELAEKMVRTELGRLLTRACQIQGDENKAMAKEKITAMQDDLLRLLYVGERSLPEDRQAWTNYFSLLDILMFIERITKHVANRST